MTGQLRAAMTPLRLRDLTHQWDEVNIITDMPRSQNSVICDVLAS